MNNVRCEYPGTVVQRPRSTGHADHRQAAAEADTARNSLSSEEIASDEGVEEPELEQSDAEQEPGLGASQKPETEESSPEREMESDWSSGQASAANTGDRPGQEAAPAVLPAPPPADPQDYRVYFYDPKVPLASLASDTSKEEIDIFKNLRKLEDPWEILFMRAEGIHAHGYQSHACEMAVRLALDMLKNPPDLITDAPPLAMKGKKRRVCAASHQITHTASLTLQHCAFLCTVLSETAHLHGDHLNLAFQIGMFGLEMARPPASTKPMEVKLAHQESELVTLLKKLPLGASELCILRERAVQLREGTLKSRGEALLPLMLASFIFDSLVLAQQPSGSRDASRYSSQRMDHLMGHRSASDELLGFEAACAAIGLKANVSEADHPLLCEGTRRQRGDLALTLLVCYKEDPHRLTRIMDKLLDKEIHQLLKSPILPSYYTCRPTDPHHSAALPAAAPPPQPQQQQQQPQPQQPQQPQQQQQPPPQAAVAAPLNQVEAGMAYLNLGARPRERPRRPSREDRLERPEAGGGGAAERRAGSPSPDWDWEAKFRCASLRVAKPRTPGDHMASIDSSAPETASSDNSPTLVRRFKPPPSESGSSGNSSDSSGRPQVESPGMAVAGPGVFPVPGAAHVAPRLEPAASQPPSHQPAVGMMEMTNLTRTTLPNIKVTRFKGKRSYPSIPNQPSEASAHFMFELAKTVLTKAGGSSSTSLFTQPTANQNPRGPQRALHMCAFQIGLYALGLHNRVTPNWISRTYSSHVSWITGQAMEIGATAISFLIGTWEGHLTPPEAANIADRASRGRDNMIVSSAAELALSVLNQAHALNQNEIARAILQCKEQSDTMLEKACLAVENAATGGGVYPEVMFDVARHWFELYKRHSPPGTLTRDDAEVSPATNRPPPPVENLPMVNQQPPASLAPASNSLSAAFPLGQMNPGLAAAASFPAVYSLIPGYPAIPSPNLPLHMYVGPPPHHLPLVPSSLASGSVPGAGIVGQFPGLQHPSLHGLQMFPNVSQEPGAGPRFNIAGGPLFHLSVPGLSMAPLLPTPPAQHLQQGVALLAHPPPSASPLAPPQLPATSSAHVVNGNALACQRYLMSAYRVGMVALETLGRRVSEDRPQTKFTRNPSYAEDVKWLLGVAKKLGLGYLQNFLMCVMATVVSPFILQDLTWDCGCFLAAVPCPPSSSLSQHQVSAVVQQIRTHPYLTSLAQKCYQMYYQCIHQRLYHLTPAEYEDFTGIILHARKVTHPIQLPLNTTMYFY